MNRREILISLFVAALIVGVLAAVAILVFGAAYRPAWVTVGAAEDFPPADSPYLVMDGEFRAWLVSTEQGITIYNERSPATQCRYKWVPSNGRFEDPCCGGKWLTDGVLIPPARPGATDLWRHPFEIEDGLIRVNPDEIIRPPFPEAEAKAPCLG